MQIVTRRIRNLCSILFLSLAAIACNDKESKNDTKEEPPALGELIFVKNCKVCHAQGINGAPILGNKAMWGPRVGQGHAVLLKHASEGFGLMPAKGGNTELTDQEIADAISYMLSKLQ